MLKIKDNIVNGIKYLVERGENKKQMKHDLIYDNYKQYEIETQDTTKFANNFKTHGKSYCHRFRFENNYGASVIKHFGSYGYEDDLFELAVLFFDKDDNWNLTYNTPITSDVLGWLTNEEVLEELEEIKKTGGIIMTIQEPRVFQDMMISALRYALGRKSYITEETANFIKEYPNLIDSRVKQVMIKDIEEYEDCRNTYYNDDECDYKIWLDLKDWLEDR